MSFEHPDSLQTVATNLGVAVKKSSLFTKDKGEGVAAEDKIRSAAFSEEVLQGNNSAPVELGVGRLVVVRLLEHKAATKRELSEVKQNVLSELTKQKAQLQADEKVQKITEKLRAGSSMQAIAAENNLSIKTEKGLVRGKNKLPELLSNAIFKAPKPLVDKPSIFNVVLANGERLVVSLSKVTLGTMGEDDKKQLELAKKNIANAFGQTEFNQTLNSLQRKADVTVNAKTQTQ